MQAVNFIEKIQVDYFIMMMYNGKSNTNGCRIFSIKAEMVCLKKNRTATAAAANYALLAAVFYALNTPFSKILLNNVPPTFMAAFLYIGAGFGVGIMSR